MEKTYIKINVLEQLVLALGTNDDLTVEIEKEYSKNKDRYYTAYRESEFYQDKYFEIYPIRYYIQLQKVAGIVQHSYQENNDMALNRIIKKGYSKIFRYITQNKVIQYSKLLKIICGNRDISEMTAVDIKNAYIVAIYLCINYGKEIDKFELMKSDIVDILEVEEGESSNFTYPVSNIKKEKIDALRKEFCMEEDKINLTNILDMYVKKDIDAYLTKIGYSPDSVDDEIYEKRVNEVITKGGPVTVLTFLSNLLRGVGFYANMKNHEITKDEGDKFICNFDRLYQQSGLPLENRELFKVVAVYCYSIIKEYRETRDNCLPQIEESIHYDIESIKKEAQIQISEIKKNEKKLHNELNKKREMIQCLEQELAKARKEAENLQGELEKKSVNDHELIALREYIFNEKTKCNEDVNELSLDSKKKELAEKEVIIIGGHENWVTKMKQVFPEFLYISPDSTNRKIDFLKEPNKIIVFNTATNSHSLYYKVISVINNKNKLHYLNGNYNVDMAIEKIYEFIQ